MRMFRRQKNIKDRDEDYQRSEDSNISFKEDEDESDEGYLER